MARTIRKQKVSFSPSDHWLFGGDRSIDIDALLEYLKGEDKEKSWKEEMREQDIKLGIIPEEQGDEIYDPNLDITDAENEALAKRFKKEEEDRKETYSKMASFKPDVEADSKLVEGLLSKVPDSLLANREYTEKNEHLLDLLADEKKEKEWKWNYSHYQNPDNTTDTSMITKDSSSTPSASKVQAGLKAATMLNDLLNPKDEPLQQIRGAGTSRGSIAFPSLLTSTQKPRHPRYVNKGLL